MLAPLVLVRGVWLSLALVVAGSPAKAQESNRPATIRAIVVDRNEVFDSAEVRRFWGFGVVNSLHAQTRPYVIRRELLFDVGEAYDSARVNESARNLRALSIFADVRIDTIPSDSGLVVVVRTTEGWTTNVGFGIRTSGAERVLSVFLQEINLLGTRTIATLGYETDPDRNTVIVGFDTPRLIANRVGVGASYSRRSDGHSASAGVRHPFFNLSSRRAASLDWALFDSRVLRYERGTRVAVDSARRKLALVRAEVAVAPVASPRGYVRVGVMTQVRRDDFGPEGGTAEIPRTITVAAIPFVALRAPRFIQLRNYEAMGRVEDVDLGASLRADVSLAPRAWGYERDGIGGRLSGLAGLRMPTGFVQLAAGAGGLRSSAGVDSSSLDARALAVSQPNDRHLLIANASAGRLNNPPFGVYYDLGLGYGIRAFPSHAFTGDRYFLVNGEYRWLALPRVLGLVGLGVAGFVDHGGAWFRGEEKRTGTDAGVGLRIGSIRSAGTIVGRVDLAYRFEGDRERAGWVLSLGRGFVWQR